MNIDNFCIQWRPWKISISVRAYRKQHHFLFFSLVIGVNSIVSSCSPPLKQNPINYSKSPSPTSTASSQIFSSSISTKRSVPGHLSSFPLHPRWLTPSWHTTRYYSKIATVAGSLPYTFTLTFTSSSDTMPCFYPAVWLNIWCFVSLPLQ